MRHTRIVHCLLTHFPPEEYVAQHIVILGPQRKRPTPAHTALRYILQRLDPAAVEQIFRRHVAGLKPAGKTGPLRAIALDGKVLRRSFDQFTDRKAAQVLHAFDTGSNPGLAHLETDDKSYPTKFRPHSASSANATWLSASSHSTPCTAKETLTAAIEAQAQLVVQLKDNQPTLLHQAQAVSAAGKPTMTETSLTRGRNRRETRTVAVFEPVWDGEETEWKPLVKQVIQVTRNVLQRSAKTDLRTSSSEVAFYLASAPLIAPQLAAIRKHPRRHVPGRQLAHSHQPGSLRSSAQLRLQHPTLQQDR